MFLKFLLTLLLLNTWLQAETYKIGAVLILTSDQAAYGIAMQEGIEIALKECNQKLEKQGDQIKVIYEDSALRPQKAHTAAMKLITQDKVIAGLNSAYSEVMSNGKLFEKHKVPAITLWDSSKEIEAIGNYIFGIGLWTPSSAEVSANFAFDTLKAKTAVVINTEADWSEIVAGLFKEKFKSKGGKILDHFSVPPDNNDFKTILTRTKSYNPDVIYAPLTEDMVTFYKQVKQLKIPAKIIASDTVGKEHIDQLPEAFEGTYQSNAPALGVEKLGKLRAKYQAAFNREAKLPLMSAWGYDGLNLLCEAIANKQTTSEEIKDYLYKVKNFPGLSNNITFNQSGSSPVIEKMYQIKDSEFVIVE